MFTRLKMPSFFHKKQKTYPSWMLFAITGIFAATAGILILGNGHIATQIKSPEPESPNSPEIQLSSPKRQLSVKAQGIRTKALSLNPRYKDEHENRDITQEQGFQITYIGPDDRFVIHIWDEANQKAIIKTAEDYFLKSVLQTNDKNAACELDVIVATKGLTYPLSFCE